MINKEILVQTGKNAIKLLDIEIEGKRLRGDQIGDYFKEQEGNNTEMKILILGVNGFIGHHLINRILKEKKDWTVYGMDLGSDRLGNALHDPAFQFSGRRYRHQQRMD